jgi:glycosyltransferase involved in cell wall biosynthesis
MSGKIGKPLITFAIFVYNQDRFIREAVESAFSQKYSPLEIVLSDDCSSDRTFSIMSEMAEAYRGPHTIILNRNNRNLGIGGHVNRIMEIARGDLIVAAAGDDISLPNRVGKIFQAWKDSGGKAKSIYSRQIEIDEYGNVQRPLAVSYSKEEFLPERLVNRNYLFGILTGSAHAWSREVFDIFGPMLTPLTCEDIVIPFRSALLGEIGFVDEPLLMHRRHANNVWSYEGEDFSDPNGCFRMRRFLTFEKIAAYRNWLADLSKMSRVSPERSKEIENLKNAVARRLTASQREKLLFESGYARRLVIVASSVLEGTTMKELRQRIGMFLLPFVYRWYLKFKSYCEKRQTMNTAGGYKGWIRRHYGN